MDCRVLWCLSFGGLQLKRKMCLNVFVNMMELEKELGVTQVDSTIFPFCSLGSFKYSFMGSVQDFISFCSAYIT